MLLSALLLASARIQMRKVDGSNTLSQPINPITLDLAARAAKPSHAWSTSPGNFHQIRDRTRGPY